LVKGIKEHKDQEILFSSFNTDSDIIADQQSSYVYGIKDENDLTFKNEKTQYLTHGFHSYPAKFIPQLPTWLMKKYSREDDTILDPFVGSGTTLVEALLNNRNCYGVEINPIGRLTSQAKSTPIDTILLLSLKGKFYDRLAILYSKYFVSDGFFNMGKEILNLWIPEIENIDKWFLPDVITELSIILKAINEIENNEFKTLLLVAFSSIIKTVSNARTEERNPKLRKELRKKPNTIKIFKGKLDRMAKDLIDFSEIVKGKKVKAKIIGKDARKLPLKMNEIDLVITSPPYAYAMDYVRMHKLSLYWLGEDNLINLDKKFIGTEKVYSNLYKEDFRFDIKIIDDVLQKLKNENRKKAYIVYNYFTDMRKCFEEMHRVMRKHAKACIVIGNSTVQNIEIQTHTCFDELAKKIGFKIYPTLERNIPLEKKGLSNVHTEYGGEMVQKEYINIFEK
jgi:DNA modification methylase